MTSSFLLFGAGYSARAFADMRKDSAVRISGTTRSQDRLDVLRAAGINPFLFGDGPVSAELADELRQATHLIISISPGKEGGDPVLDLLRDNLDTVAPRLRWIGYLSTVGVYGGRDGGWVDESGECRPTTPHSLRRVEVETEWTALGRQANVPVALLRLSGIYGPGRNAFVNLAAGTARRLIKPGQVFNRIHVDDIAGALWHLAERELGGIYNVTDDMPAPPQDVVAFAADLMGVEPPPEIPFETAELSPMARSFYGENKRVSNAAIKAAGYAFSYPDYKSAFRAMWDAGNWAGAGKRDARSPIPRQS